MLKIFILCLLSFNLYAVVLLNNDLIVVHPSRIYHTNAATIAFTNDLISKASRSILTYQNMPALDSNWYITEPSENLVYSKAGELDMSFSDDVNNIELNFAGGYLTSCLGRTISEIIATFVVHNKLKTLTINLKSKAIFTGHQIIKDKLEPKTAYEESILDDTIDGITLNRVLRFTKVDYIEEFIRIGFIKKSPIYKLNLKFSSHYFKNKAILKFENKLIIINLH